MKAQKIKDHLGNEFDSHTSLAKHYNIPPQVFRERKHRGWSIEKILLTPYIPDDSRYVAFDHLGNKFKSIRAMCDFYKIHTGIFYKRKNAGWSLEDALTTPTREKCYSHTSEEYDSFNKLCKSYNIKPSTASRRLRAGWSLEDALTKPIPSSEDINFFDHKGNGFNTKTEMAESYGLSRDVLSHRLSSGWSLEKALETPLKSPPTKDHLGNIFPNIPALCSAYNIPTDTFRRRLKAGWSLEDALTKPIRKQNNVYKDASGNEFFSIQSAAKFHKISQLALANRLHEEPDFIKALEIEKNLKTERNQPKYFDLDGNGYTNLEELAKKYNLSRAVLDTRLKKWKDSTLEDILLTPAKSNRNWTNCKDHLGNVFPSLKAMCDYHNIITPVFLKRERQGWPLDLILSVPQSHSFSYGEKQIKELLSKKEINFVFDKSIKNNIFSTKIIEDFCMLRADFIIQDFGIIEFDGVQHFIRADFFENKDYDSTFARDDKKTELCEKYKIPLLRIRYDQRDSIEDLINDFFENPKKYIKKHNKFLSNKKYYSIRK